MNANTNTPLYDAESDIAAWLVGAGILLIQVCAVIPGLLPILLLTLPFVLPLVVLGLVAGVLIGVPLGIWRLLAWAARPVLTRIRRTEPINPVPETSNA